jgi:2-polyprenyl-3-methyl-5-hydroxy-6-metoxy-1,4-benzoquinol methylase
VGSGPGFFAEHLVKAGYVVTAVEMTEGAKDYAIRHNSYSEILNEDISQQTSSIYGKKFDCVISWAVIEHVDDVSLFLNLLKFYAKKWIYLHRHWRNYKVVI